MPVARELPVVLAIGEAAEAVFHEREDADELLDLLFAGPPIPDGRKMVARDLQQELEELVTALASCHWRPNEIIRQVRRRMGAEAEQLAAVIVHQARHRQPDGGDPAWAAEASVIAAPGWQLDEGAPSWASDVLTAVRLVGHLSHLPALPACRPGDGASGGGPESAAKERMMAKVRHLLSKAESTGFPEEAEACTVKVQELLSRTASTEPRPRQCVSR